MPAGVFQYAEKSKPGWFFWSIMHFLYSSVGDSQYQMCTKEYGNTIAQLLMWFGLYQKMGNMKSTYQAQMIRIAATRTNAPATGTPTIRPMFSPGDFEMSAEERQTFTHVPAFSVVVMCTQICPGFDKTQSNQNILALQQLPQNWLKSLNRCLYSFRWNELVYYLLCR